MVFLMIPTEFFSFVFFSFVFWLFCSNDESDDVHDPIVLHCFAFDLLLVVYLVYACLMMISCSESCWS